MEELSPIQKLDHLLNYLKYSPFSVGTHPGELREPLFSFTELQRALEKLRRDQYIFVNENNWWQVTFEGYEFKGYKIKIEDDRLNREVLQRNASQAKTYANLLLAATSFAGLGAILLFGWYILLWFYPTHSDYVKFHKSPSTISKKKQ